MHDILEKGFKKILTQNKIRNYIVLIAKHFYKHWIELSDMKKILQDIKYSLRNFNIEWFEIPYSERIPKLNQ